MRKLQGFLDWDGGGENIAYPVVAANRVLLEKLGIAWSEWEQKEPYLRAGCTIYLSGSGLAACGAPGHLHGAEFCRNSSGHGGGCGPGDRRAGP